MKDNIKVEILLNTLSIYYSDFFSLYYNYNRDYNFYIKFLR